MDTSSQPQAAPILSPDNSKGPAVRKRAQIASAGKTMFVWVAVSSVIIGGALVVSIFLVEQLLFNQRVISQKAETISNLKTDNQNVKTLADNVRALEANQSLIRLKAHPDDNAVQVVLDALPSDANSAALGGSLQNLLHIDGIQVQDITVDPVTGIEAGVGDAALQMAAPTPNPTGVQNAITFSVTVEGNQDAIKQALTNFEKSIRTIDVTNIKIESNAGGTLKMTLQGQAYYQLAASLQLTDTEVK